jgi:hypothetical protein
MAETVVLAPTLGGFATRLGELTGYRSAVGPVILNQPQPVVRVFVDGCLVLTVARLENLMHSIVGVAARHRERALREHLTQNGSRQAREHAKTCDLRGLVRLAKREHLSFLKDGGVRLDRLFGVLFGCSVWANAEVHDALHDLVVIRNMIVHDGGAEVGFGDAGHSAAQLRRSDVLNVKTYPALDPRTHPGRHPDAYVDWNINEIDPRKALGLLLRSAEAISLEYEHLCNHLARDDRWLHLP